ncbi:MAG: hypothetical protein WCA21_02200, partial [Terracidiphilus sp.]
LGAVLVGTGVALVRGKVPGGEPGPYILRFDEDKPNPLYRRVCYSFAWNAALNYALLNLTGLTIAAVTGIWQMKQIYYYAYLPLAAVILLLGGLGKLPRVESSTRKEGTHRRYFYGTVWAITAAQTVLLILWKALPQTQETSWVKLAAFVGVLAVMGWLSYQGVLPRTRPILPGESMVAD